ncbi:MAG TPA: alanine dehydrogenase [Rhabdochlamydiaceae bacterium]|nr:alanine dehydrogenase [Rhabdochlamydiaceae bacterium]
MIIGIPKEIKDNEYRVGATPDGVKSLTQAGHQVLVQKSAGERIGFTDDLYLSCGAKIVKSAADVYSADMVIKVKEPQLSEFALLREGQILFCYLHLAPDPEQTKHLLERKVIGVAYETVTDPQNRLPLLVPMSEIAGRISIQAGARSLEMIHGGKGLLLGGVPGVSPAKVIVLGGGVVGTNAARMAMGLGADVTIFDNNLNRLRDLDAIYGPTLKTHYSSHLAVENAVAGADLVVGAVLIPGKSAPRLVTKEMIKKMTPGSVIVDVAIDQGGCFETSRPTTHSEPTYSVDGVIHYCVTNMPGACARTSTQALTNATMPYALKIANLGYKAALKEDPHLMNGLNVYLGKVTNKSVAEDLKYEYVPPGKLF